MEESLASESKLDAPSISESKEAPSVSQSVPAPSSPVRESKERLKEFINISREAHNALESLKKKATLAELTEEKRITRGLRSGGVLPGNPFKKYPLENASGLFKNVAQAFKNARGFKETIKVVAKTGTAAVGTGVLAAPFAIPSAVLYGVGSVVKKARKFCFDTVGNVDNVVLKAGFGLAGLAFGIVEASSKVASWIVGLPAEAISKLGTMTQQSLARGSAAVGKNIKNVRTMINKNVKELRKSFNGLEKEVKQLSAATSKLVDLNILGLGITSSLEEKNEKLRKVEEELRNRKAKWYKIKYFTEKKKAGLQSSVNVLEEKKHKSELEITGAEKEREKIKEAFEKKKGEADKYSGKISELKGNLKSLEESRSGIKNIGRSPTSLANSSVHTHVPTA